MAEYNVPINRNMSGMKLKSLPKCWNNKISISKLSPAEVGAGVEVKLEAPEPGIEPEVDPVYFFFNTIFL